MKNVIGETRESEKINKIWGWDEDEFYNPVRIIESDLFVDHSEAEINLHILQEKYIRQEWWFARPCILVEASSPDQSPFTIIP